MLILKKMILYPNMEAFGNILFNIDRIIYQSKFIFTHLDLALSITPP